MKYPQGKRLLVDGDILKYRCAFACEHTYYLVVTGAEEGGVVANYFPNHKEAKAYAEPNKYDIWSRKEIQPEEFAYECVNTTLGSFASKFSPSDISIYLSDNPTFRERVATTKKYKGNRDGVEKPKWYKEVGDFLNTKGAITLKELEADDAIAIEMHKDPEGTICVSIDKDMLQVPGNHYNWVKDEYLAQSKKAADFQLATQLLTGDATDNIPGIPGVGPKAADKILSGARSSRELFDRVLKAYEQTVKEGWKQYFVEQYKLVRLLRTYEEKDSFPDLEVEETISRLTK